MGLSKVKHSSAHDHGARRSEGFVDDLSVGIGVAPGQAVTIAPVGQTVQPLMEPLAAVTQRPLRAVVRSGDESIQ